MFVVVAVVVVVVAAVVGMLLTVAGASELTGSVGPFAAVVVAATLPPAQV